MFFPYATDAPVYYWPFATVGLIIANVAVFVAMAFGVVTEFDSWVLSYGDGLHPIQWVLSLFTHGGIEHLLGNMLFLWVFGLVIEGKLGWWKFLGCFLAIGALECLVEQLVMLGAEEPGPGSIGASAAIFGLVAMAAIWAPMNEITFFWILGFRTGTFEIGIAVLAICYVGFEILMICVFGSDAGSSWLHLAGFAFGTPVAILLLKGKLVDCENWDIFSYFGDDFGNDKKERAPAEVLTEVRARQKKKDEQMLGAAKDQFRLYLQQGNAAAGVKLFEKMKNVGGGLTLDRQELTAIIQSLHASKRWADSAPLMAEYIGRFPGQADPVRLKLAQICIVELQRPAKALELLSKVNVEALAEKQASLVQRIQAKAKQMQDQGVVELEVETW
jgi:membrane associated rhomboid family serine protease